MKDFSDFHLTYWLDAIALEYRQRGFSVTYQPFAYGADFRPLSSLSTGTIQTTTIDRDADFIWCENSYVAYTTAGANQIQPDLLVQHTAVSSQRDLENQPVHLMNVYGTGERPFIWTKPIVVSAKSAITVVLSSNVAADLNVSLTWLGVKAFLTRLR